MAKDKTKDEIKADIVDEEITDKTIEEVKADSPQAEEKIEDAEQDFTKAGKRSKKGKEEAAEKEEKIARQKGELDESGEPTEEEQVKKGPKPKVRPLIERKSKRYRVAAEKIETGKEYNLEEAVKLAQETSTVKFDASVEMHIKLNVDPKQADQNIRGSIVLPHGTGRDVRVAVLADDEGLKAAKKAGADLADADELFAKLEKQNEEFDVLVSTPQMMSQLGKYAKYLGPKGMMPNPKSGTVTNDIERTVKELKAGRVEYRVDRYGIVHVGVGKVSFSADKLLENATLLMKTLRDARPASVKNEFIRSITVSTSMGPGIAVSTTVSK